MPFSNPRECRVCKRVFLSPQQLNSHFQAFHCNRHYTTFSFPAAATPTTFRHYPNLNQNPNPAFHARTHLDHYRRVNCDNQEKFHNGLPPPPARKYRRLLPKISEIPKLMDLFPATSSEDTRTLPLLYQLELRRVEDTVTENGGTNSSSIDLSLRL